MNKKLNTTEIILTVLAVLFSAAPIALTAFYYDIYPVFNAVDIFIIVFFFLDICIFIASLWRLMRTMNSQSFRTATLVPAAAAVLFGVLSIIITSGIDKTIADNRFQQDKADYAAAVEYLDSQQYSDTMALPQQYAHLSRGGSVMAYSCQNGKYTCYLFLMLDHSNRYEGVLYLSGAAPVLYYEITDRYASYSYDELGGNYVRIALYK